MIIQIWQAITPIANMATYQTLLIEKAFPFYQVAEGNMGVYLCREINNQLANFLFLSLWSSREALSQFRGPRIETIARSPEEKNLLLAFESMARNYEVVQISEPKKESNT